MIMKSIPTASHHLLVVFHFTQKAFRFSLTLSHSSIVLTIRGLINLSMRTKHDKRKMRMYRHKKNELPKKKQRVSSVD